ncbi:MAG: hypothetical protein FD138_1551 [Planctomycetota bacterium]|nr:MAG: hypothetical protein FD138_1551 [Planctomycetota bacterium]
MALRSTTEACQGSRFYSRIISSVRPLLPLWELKRRPRRLRPSNCQQFNSHWAQAVRITPWPEFRVKWCVMKWRAILDSQRRQCPVRLLPRVRNSLKIAFSRHWRAVGMSLRFALDLTPFFLTPVLVSTTSAEPYSGNTYLRKYTDMTAPSSRNCMTRKSPTSNSRESAECCTTTTTATACGTLAMNRWRTTRSSRGQIRPTQRTSTGAPRLPTTMASISSTSSNQTFLWKMISECYCAIPLTAVDHPPMSLRHRGSSQS